MDAEAPAAAPAAAEAPAPDPVAEANEAYDGALAHADPER